MSETKHTPGPWVIFSDHGEAKSILPAGRPGEICRMAGERVNANAAFIVRACNNYERVLIQRDELAAALIVARDLLKTFRGYDKEFAKVAAALAKVKP